MPREMSGRKRGSLLDSVGIARWTVAGVKLRRRAIGSHMLFEGGLGKNVGAGSMHGIVERGRQFSYHFCGEPPTNQVVAGRAAKSYVSSLNDNLCGENEEHCD